MPARVACFVTGTTDLLQMRSFRCIFYQDAYFSPCLRRIECVWPGLALLIDLAIIFNCPEYVKMSKSGFQCGPVWKSNKAAHILFPTFVEGSIDLLIGLFLKVLSNTCSIKARINAYISNIFINPSLKVPSMKQYLVSQIQNGVGCRNRKRKCQG